MANQIHGRGLAHARLAHQPDHLPRFDVQVDLVQHRLALVVPKRHVLEPDVAFDAGHGHGIGILIRLGRGVDNLKNALGAGNRARHPGVDHPEPLQRPVEQHHIAVKRHQRAQGQLPVDHLQPAVIPHDQHPRRGEQGHRLVENAPVDFGGDADARQFVVALFEHADFLLFLCERLDHANAGEGLVDPRHRLGPRLHPAREKLPHAPVKRISPNHDQGNGNEHQNRQGPTHHQQRDEDAHQHHGLDHQIGQAIHQKLLQAIAVTRHARHHRAHLPLVVKL